MRKFLMSLTLLAGPAISFASPVLTLDPPSGDISGQAGSTVGWGFRLTSDGTGWISVIGTVALFETNPALGSFTDFIGPQGGPVSGALAAAADWVQLFDLSAASGLGAFAIDPGAQIGDSDSGTFRVLYETFTDNPATCGGCMDGVGSVDVGFSVTAAATVSATPEPGSWVLVAGGIWWLGSRRRRRR
jgi:hypothetical protein